MPQVLIASRLASLDGPSKMPQPSAHAYCVPDRLTPRSWTGLSLPSSSWFPLTRMASGAGAGAVVALVVVTGTVEGAVLEAGGGVLADEVGRLDDRGGLEDVAELVVTV